MYRRLPFILGVMSMGLFGGVAAQEVVQAEPARDVLGDHVRQGQLGEQRPRGLLWQTGEAGHRRCRGVRPRCSPSSRNTRAAEALSWR